PNLVPYQLFHAADHPIVVAVGTDAQWNACARALGLDDLADDAALAVNSGRVQQRSRIVDAFERALARRPAEEWKRLLSAAGVPVGVVSSVLDVVRDAGGSPLTGMPSNVGGAVRYAPPSLDEHGALVRAHAWDAFSRVPTIA